MEKQDIKEFIEDDGTLINSKMPPSINRMATSKQTTDQHVASSRQGMVWMNYRRFYGEAGEKLPFEAEADKWANDPQKFFEFLKSKGKQDEFNKYFVKKEDKKDVKSALNEAAKTKMKQLVEDLVAKKIQDDLVKKDEDKPDIEEIKEREPALMKKVTAVAEAIHSVFEKENERDVIISYIEQIINA